MRKRVLLGTALMAAFLAPHAAVAAPPDGPLGERTLVIGTRAEPRSLNPIAITTSEGHQIAGLVFLKLLQEKDDFLTFEPQLAESWRTSDDGLDITFVLRKDARWSDGTPVTAEDVRFTWELQVDTTVVWPSASIKSGIRDVEVVDARTVVFHFRTRYLYQLMDAVDGVILPRHLLGATPRAEVKASPFGRTPVGNGPYRVARWVEGQFIELERNPEYFGPAPRVERVLFKFVPDAVTLAAQLKAGEIDLLEAVQSGDLEDVARRRPDVKIHAIDSRRMSFIAWNNTRAPFDDREVRRALTTAIDRAEIIRTVWGGRARECTSPIVPILWAYDPATRALPFDLAAARAALEARGYRDADKDGILDREGKPFEFELIVNDAQNRIDVVTMVQAQLALAGIRVNLRVMEYAAYIERVLATDYDAALIEWKVPTKVDLTGLYHTSAMRPKGFNFASYSNPDVDRGIDEALLQTDQAAARPIWNEVQRRIYDDQPFTFIAVPQELTAIDDRFCNVNPSAISFFVNLARWGVAPDCAP